MSFDLNEVGPQDPYIIKIVSPVNFTHLSVLIELYQPFIGTKVMGFYFTLVNQLPLGGTGASKIRLHRQLLSQMYIPFKEIVNARKTLEAVGLLKSIKYQHQDTGEALYEYSLLPPLSPEQFFQSDILSLLLLNRIGKNYFLQLKEKYTNRLEWNNGFYKIEKVLTKSFDEVFDSILASELKVLPGSELEQLIQPYSTEKTPDAGKLLVKKKYLDMEFVKGMFSDNYQLSKALDDKIEDLLQELAFLYQLSETDVISLLKDHTIYEKSGRLDSELLRKRIREKYHYLQKEVALVQQTELIAANKQDKDKKQATSASPQSKNKSSSENTDKANRHSQMLEGYSPIQLMAEYQGGAKIAEADLKIIESLGNDYGLPYPVVNVLIEYVMLTNDLKLPKNFSEKIAGHWRRLKISTVQEAQALAKKEHQLYKSWQTSTKRQPTTDTSKKNKEKRTTKKENIPDYILQQEDKYHQSNSNNTETEIDHLKKAKIDQLLKDLGEI